MLSLCYPLKVCRMDSPRAAVRVVHIVFHYLHGGTYMRDESVLSIRFRGLLDGAVGVFAIAYAVEFAQQCEQVSSAQRDSDGKFHGVS
jgi:hypothetical protein